MLFRSARLKALFGTRALPVLVPPWNRFAGELLPLLPGNGMEGLSAMASRAGARLPPGLVAIDVHVDLVAWRDGRGFVGAATALGGIVSHLRARRLGAADPAHPIGILTHHQIMDGPTAAFLGRLIELTRAHAATSWATVGELLQ